MAQDSISMPHPGTITYRADDGRPDRVVPVEEVPEASRFVHLDRDGRQTHDPAQAAARVPIVEVEMVGASNPAGPRSIVEYGPGRRFLRSSYMPPSSARHP